MNQHKFAEMVANVMFLGAVFCIWCGWLFLISWLLSTYWGAWWLFAVCVSSLAGASLLNLALMVVDCALRPPNGSGP